MMKKASKKRQKDIIRRTFRRKMIIIEISTPPLNMVVTQLVIFRSLFIHKNALFVAPENEKRARNFVYLCRLSISRGGIALRKILSLQISRLRNFPMPDCSRWKQHHFPLVEGEDELEHLAWSLGDLLKYGHHSGRTD